MNKTISNLHYITQETAGITHDELALSACLSGVDWIQLRVKNKSYSEWLDIALKTELVCRKYNVKLIINDNVSIAKAVKAHGVHLGKTDMSPLEARQLLGADAIIGGTANSFEDIQILPASGIDYIGLGPFRFTSTKENLSPVLGMDGYDRIIKKCTAEGITIPIIAIGGIKTDDIKTLMNTGIQGIAIASAINLAENKIEAAKKIISELQEFKICRTSVISSEN